MNSWGRIRWTKFCRGSASSNRDSFAFSPRFAFSQISRNMFRSDEERNKGTRWPVDNARAVNNAAAFNQRLRRFDHRWSPARDPVYFSFCQDKRNQDKRDFILTPKRGSFLAGSAPRWIPSLAISTSRDVFDGPARNIFFPVNRKLCLPRQRDRVWSAWMKSRYRKRPVTRSLNDPNYSTQTFNWSFRLFADSPRFQPVLLPPF